jgi:hypothetical protein
MPDGHHPEAFERWLAGAEVRYLASLRFAEVTRALRALSSVYVERRHTVARGAALETAGKRAAFALYYAPLHYLTVWHVVRALAPAAFPDHIVDLGCGTGAGGAAWATAADGTPRVIGLDRHPWAVVEARWTYAQFGLEARTRLSDLARPPAMSAFAAATGGRPAVGIVAAYLLNELRDVHRRRLLSAMVDAGRRGAHVLVMEPIARRITPWWEEAQRVVLDGGGRSDEWRFPTALPPLVARLGDAAGLNHGELTARTLTMNLARPECSADA